MICKALSTSCIVSMLVACALPGTGTSAVNGNGTSTSANSTVRPPTAESTDAATRQFRALLEASDEAGLDRKPLFALYRGDLRRAGQFGDFLSDRYIEAERQAANDELAQIAAIDRDKLGAVDKIAYDTFVWNRRDAAKAHQPEFARLWSHLPIDHYNSIPLLFAAISSGESVAPYKTVADYDNGLTRIDGFVDFLALATTRMREGMALGIVQPRFVVERMIPQFEAYADQALEQSQYYQPIRQLPKEFSETDRQRLTRSYTRVIEDKLRPAFRSFAGFLRDDYLVAARSSVGLSALPGGARYYEYLVRSRTTTNMTAAQIHELGLSEVARITAAIRQVATDTGFKGTLQQFFAQVRDDPRFRPASVQALQNGYYDIARKVDLGLPRLFKHKPQTPLEIRPIPDIEAAGSAGAYYVSGSLDTGKPGVFFFNSHDLPSRNTVGMETLYLHEAIPGHHLQGSLAIEDQGLPKILRFEWVTSFGEGWALYSESLGAELGLFTDPYQLFGRLQDEQWRAMRLVVDTGLHEFGWTRERAIDYMLANSAKSRTEVTAEVERYIVDPGQALAYKIGELTIRRLRTRAEQALGNRFDVREFHDQVLSTGALPLDVLTVKIDGWIASRSSAQASAMSAAAEPSRR